MITNEMITKEEIDSIKIEHRGEQRYWNITMFVEPRYDNGKVPYYADLVDMADSILREAKGLGEEWLVSNAEVMAWSSRDTRGVFTPNRFRVTLDMVTKDMEAPSNENM